MPSSDFATPAGLTREQFATLLDRARWAPSGDNSQPWRVRVADDGALELRLDDQEPPAFLDIDQEASRIALGAYLENLALAASQQRVAAQASFDVQPPVEVRVTFAPAPNLAPDPLAEFIERRVSNRRLYAAKPCSTEQLAALRDSLQGIAGVDLTFSTSVAERAAIGAAAALADRVRMQHRRCHEEFHAKIRWTEEASRRDRTGFDYRTFEIKPHEMWLLRMTRSYQVFRLVDALTGMSRIAARLARRQIEASGAIGCLSIAHRKPPRLINVGRALQRVWLAATRAGLAFQVLAVAPLFLRRCELGGEGFSPRQQAILEQVRQHLAMIDTLPPPETIALLFRIGGAPPPTARTSRLPA